MLRLCLLRQSSTVHLHSSLLSLHLGEGRPLNPQLCFTPGWRQVPHHLSLSRQTCSIFSSQHSHTHSVLGILYWIYTKCISYILFVAGIGSNTTNNTEILQNIYVFKPILKILWRRFEVLINQCNKRLVFLKRCFTYREGHWQVAEQTDKEASIALKFRNRTGQQNKEQKCGKL